MSNWETRRLVDLTTKIGSGATPRGGKGVYQDVGTSFIRSQNVYDLRFDDGGLAHISDQAADALKGVTVNSEDVLVNITGESVTRTCLVADEVLPARVSQHVAIVRANPQSLDPRYLLYSLISPRTKATLNTLSQAGATRRALTKGHLEALEIQVPPLEEQERIAGVLGAFDDLIETNRRLAGKMRDTAQWAARGALAGRPKTVPLTDFATVDKGFSYKSAELEGDEMVLLNLKNAGRGGHFRRDGYKPLSTTRHKPGHVVQAGDVIVAMTDLTQDRDIVARPLRVQAPAAQVEIVASLDLAVLRPRNGGTREYIWAVLSDPSFRSHALGYCSGTTVLHMKGRAFSDYLVPEVDARLIEHLGEAVEPLVSGADEVDLEADALTAQRDELLPLLMSGKVRVRDVEAAVS